MARIVTKARQFRHQREAKLGRPITVEEVAQATGIVLATLVAVERDQTEYINFMIVQKLCHYYGVSVADMMVLHHEDGAEQSA